MTSKMVWCKIQDGGLKFKMAAVLLSLSSKALQYEYGVQESCSELRNICQKTLAAVSWILELLNYAIWEDISGPEEVKSNMVANNSTWRLFYEAKAMWVYLVW